MSERRERELVLAPNEYAYVLDTTKGHVNCYVGPNKTSLAQTDQPVRFDAESKRFESVDLDRAVCLFATAPENWYVVLKNPGKDDAHPKPGVANSLAELKVGRKVVVPGPTAFALWPGQMAQVIAGHRLRANEYLYVRIYDAEAAAERWHQALGQPTPAERPKFTAGEKRSIKGSDVRFYMPPTGVEVVPDAAGRFVREAITLERLEYAILEGEDGRRRYVRGEAVVFPGPEERVVPRDGAVKQRAIELSQTTGLHIKVVAPYTDPDGTEHTEGEELFLTGDTLIYFPQEAHQIIPQRGRGDAILHQAVAVPRGQGRYLLHRHTGEVSLARGPRMLLPDPRAQVLVRRVLTDRACRLLYPGNADALAHNRALRAGVTLRRPKPEEPPADGGWQGPPAITLDDRFDGAVRVEIWAGFAVQIVDEAGGRRVVQGPAATLLEYHEALQPLRLSTGTPKTDAERLETAYLQVRGNQVSDQIEILTRDLVRARLTVVYRVDFEGDDHSAWFAVEDYVKLLCDHTRSRLKAQARGLSIRDLQADVTPVVRDLLLGARPEGGKPRPGLRFAENGMRIYDVEVLAFEITDPAVQTLLAKAQQTAVAGAVEVAARTESLDHALKLAEIEQRLARSSAEGAALKARLEAELHASRDTLAAEAQTRAAARDAARDEAALAAEERRAALEARRLATAAAAEAQALQHTQARQTLELEALAARTRSAVEAAQAVSPQLMEALRRLGDTQLLGDLAEHFGELAAVEGRGLLATARKFLDFVPTSLVPVLGGAPEPPGS